MLKIRYESHEDFEDTKVYYRQEHPAFDRDDVSKIWDDLLCICKKESIKLFRLARQMEMRGCNPENIKKCRAEADKLGSLCFDFWEVLSPFTLWAYAFQY